MVDMSMVLEGLFPAPAGMILRSAIRAAALDPFPRTRGDDPSGRGRAAWCATFSPHPRG